MYHRTEMEYCWNLSTLRSGYDDSVISNVERTIDTDIYCQRHQVPDFWDSLLNELAENPIAREFLDVYTRLIILLRLLVTEHWETLIKSSRYPKHVHFATFDSGHLRLLLKHLLQLRYRYYGGRYALSLYLFELIDKSTGIDLNDVISFISICHVQGIISQSNDGSCQYGITSNLFPEHVMMKYDKHIPLMIPPCDIRNELKYRTTELLIPSHVSSKPPDQGDNPQSIRAFSIELNSSKNALQHYMSVQVGFMPKYVTKKKDSFFECMVKIQCQCQEDTHFGKATSRKDAEKIAALRACEHINVCIPSYRFPDKLCKYNNSI